MDNKGQLSLKAHLHVQYETWFEVHKKIKKILLWSWKDSHQFLNQPLKRNIALKKAQIKPFGSVRWYQEQQ